MAGGICRGLDVVGSTIYVQTHPFTVAGIAPPGFFGDRIIPNPPDFWMPLASEPVIEGANSALNPVTKSGSIQLAECGRAQISGRAGKTLRDIAAMAL